MMMASKGGCTPRSCNYYSWPLPQRLLRSLCSGELYTVLYRNPTNYLLLKIYTQIYCPKIPSLHYLLAISQQWWPYVDTNAEGTALDNLALSLNLSQLIVEPTNFQDNCNPSCIDLTFCDLPNLVKESGTHPSLDTHCKHQITFCRLNSRIPPAPVFKHKVWHYKEPNMVFKDQCKNFLEFLVSS